MAVDEKILECELEYTKCFSKYHEDDNIIRFQDLEIKDMYTHNFTYIKRTMDDAALKEIINQEIELKRAAGSDFCNFFIASEDCKSLDPLLQYNPEISYIGYYLFDQTKYEKQSSLPHCIIKQVDHEEMLKDLLYSDLQQDDNESLRDFSTRRCYRRGKVYLSPEGVNSYLLYHNQEIIGSCDLLIHKGVAKIEDFQIIPKHQRKGYGTTLLKGLMEIAIKNNCPTIYLVTDEGDTAKEMYEKIGFKKVGERIELFIKL